MEYLQGQAEQNALHFMKIAAQEAKKSTCQRLRCGSIIVQNNTIIGSGFNSPPANIESQRRCLNEKSAYHSKITDKTCCIHAEQRATMDVLRNKPDQIEGSILYFVRLNNNDNISKAGKPYCTICSKIALDVGVKKFVLWHDDGICVYDTDEYNDLSYKYFE